VSREHFRVRRDPARGFLIQDVSLWGTSVDGTPLPPAVKTAEGVVQPGDERELPAEARIDVAGSLVIQFRVPGA
jgi:pSer/pThr/pTyr-binding forkhead associated (FHA) protein